MEKWQDGKWIGKTEIQYIGWIEQRYVFNEENFKNDKRRDKKIIWKGEIN